MIKTLGTIVFLGVLLYGGMTFYKRGAAPNIEAIFDDIGYSLRHLLHR